MLLIITIPVHASSYSQSNYAVDIKHSVSNQDKIKVDSVARTLGYQGGDKVKVYVIFEVNKDGDIRNIRARGPQKVFEDEAIRIVSEIPQLDPIKNLEEGESMKFTLPLNLVLETDSKKKRRLKKEEKRKQKTEVTQSN